MLNDAKQYKMGRNAKSFTCKSAKLILQKSDTKSYLQNTAVEYCKAQKKL